METGDGALPVAFTERNRSDQAGEVKIWRTELIYLNQDKRPFGTSKTEG